MAYFLPVHLRLLYQIKIRKHGWALVNLNIIYIYILNYRHKYHFPMDPSLDFDLPTRYVWFTNTYINIMGKLQRFLCADRAVYPTSERWTARLASGDSDQRASTIRVIKLLRVVRTLRIVKTVACWSDDTVDRWKKSGERETSWGGSNIDYLCLSHYLQGLIYLYIPDG